MCKLTSTIALIFLIIGGLNWGLYGLAGVDVVAMLFGVGVLAKIVYIAVGLSALYGLMFFKILGLWDGKCKSASCCMEETKDKDKKK